MESIANDNDPFIWNLNRKEDILWNDVMILFDNAKNEMNVSLDDLASCI